MFSSSVLMRTAVTVLVSLSLFSSEYGSMVAEARASRDDRKDYPEIHQAFKKWGKNMYWQSYDCTTEDDYELTMFRLIGLKRRKQVANQWSKGVVLLLHGFSKDAYAWFDHRRGDVSKPFLPTTLFERGYDVWLGSVRGSRYSITHAEYDPINDNSDAKRYFNYEATTIARNDIPAMVKLIMDTQSEQKEKTGIPCKKISFIGHSHGAALMLASMSYTVKSDRYVSQMIGVEPCLLSQPDNYYPDLDHTDYLVMSSASDLLGIYSLFGANWPEQIDLICNVLGQDSAECLGLQTAGFASHPDNPFGNGEVSFKHTKHMAQMYLQDHFQEYSNWWPWIQNTRDFYVQNMSGNIPVKVIFSSQDQLCPPEKQLKYWNKIPNPGEYVYIDGVHGDQVGRQDDAYMEILDRLLAGNDNEQVISGNCDVNWGWY